MVSANLDSFIGGGAEETNWCGSLYRMQLEDSAGGGYI